MFTVLGDVVALCCLLSEVLDKPNPEASGREPRPDEIEIETGRPTEAPLSPKELNPANPYVPRANGDVCLTVGRSAVSAEEWCSCF